MLFCIVSPATLTEFDRAAAQTDALRRLAEHAPVGILTLAAVLEQHDRTSEIVDLNVLYRDYLCLEDEERYAIDFCGFAARHILGLPFDAVGFGTICSTYPLTLRIADRVKKARPDAPVILGGPQASATDVATLRRFSHIDFVLRYEAEESLPRLLEVLERQEPVESVKGLTYRRDGEIRRTASPPPIEDLDRLPLPAYHRYPYLKQARYIPLELGRGCPYACTFCSTNDFFRREFRLKSPKLIVEQMRLLKNEYKVPIFDLIHDMFTVNRKKVVEFCEAIIASGESFTWNCSARTDRVDPELLDLMAEAGCAGIFFGIETGSQKLQTELKKRLVLGDAMKSIQHASSLGLQTAVSLITGFPTETDEDFADTVDFFGRALRHENTAPQFHILAPLADTPLEREYRDRLQFDDIFSDMSHQGWEQDPADRDLIAAYPDVFSSFYAIPTPLNRPFVKEVRAFLLYGARHFRWILAALHVDQGHLLNVYRDFRPWLAAKRPDFFRDGADATGYYRQPDFYRDFPEFVADRYVDASNRGLAIKTLLAFSTAFAVAAADEPEAAPQPVSGDGRKLINKAGFASSSVPALAANVRLMKSPIDFQELIRRVAAGERLESIALTSTTLASCKRPGRWPEILQLSPKSLALLELCDGQNSVPAIIESFARSFPRSDDIPAEKAALVGLEMLRHENLIEDSSQPGTAVLEAA